MGRTNQTVYERMQSNSEERFRSAKKDIRKRLVEAKLSKAEALQILHEIIFETMYELQIFGSEEME